MSASSRPPHLLAFLNKGLTPYLYTGTLVGVSLGLITGHGGSQWLPVLCIALAQIAANTLWINRRAAGLISSRREWLFTLFNASATSAIVLITGGIASAFWILFFINVLAEAISPPRAGVYFSGGVYLLIQLASLLQTGAWNTANIGAVGLQVVLLLLTGQLVRHLYNLVLQEYDTRRQTEQEREAAESRLTKILGSVAEAIVAVDQTRAVVIFNKGAERIFGYTADEIVGQSFERLVPAYFTELHEHLYALATAAEKPTLAEAWDVAGQRRDGRVFPAEIQVSTFSEGSQMLVLVSLHDVTEREQAAAALQQANETLTLWVTEREEAALKLQEVNEKLTRWTNDLEERSSERGLLNEMGDLLQSCRNVDEAYGVIGQMARYLFPNDPGLIGLLNADSGNIETLVHWGDNDPNAPAPFAPDLCLAIQRQKLYLVTDHNPPDPLCRHVTALPAHGYLCVPLLAQGEVLGLLHLRLCSRDSSQLDLKQQFAVVAADHMALAISNLRLRESLRQQSIRDPLTGLYNRRHMEESFERELHRAQRNQQPLSVVMLDIDYFKRFNDTYGHAAGDGLLRELGKFLQQRIRGSDIACRYGGEEFILILPQASLEDTCRRAEQIRQGVQELRIQHNDQSLGPVTLSLGVATMPAHGNTAETLVQAADAALYRAKHEGRNQVVTAETAEAG